MYAHLYIYVIRRPELAVMVFIHGKWLIIDKRAVMSLCLHKYNVVSFYRQLALSHYGPSWLLIEVVPLCLEVVTSTMAPSSQQQLILVLCVISAYTFTHIFIPCFFDSIQCLPCFLSALRVCVCVCVCVWGLVLSALWKCSSKPCCVYVLLFISFVLFYLEYFRSHRGVN